MKRSLSTLALMLFIAVTASAEAVHRTEKFSSFTGIEVLGDIVVTLQEGKSYSVNLDVDARIVDFIKLGLTGNVLTLELQEKDFPNELKAQLRRKENSLLPTEVTIVAPYEEMCDGITMKGNSRLTTKGAINISKKLIINTLSNSSIIDAEASGQSLEVVMSNNSSVQITARVAEFALTGSNNSRLESDLKAGSVTLVAQNNCELTLKGNCDKLVVSGKNNSGIDALGLVSKKVEVNIANNCQCNLKAVELLDIVSVLSGASLIYLGEPVVKVGKILNSSVSSASQDSRK